MNIIFSAVFDEVVRETFGITREHVRKALLNPDGFSRVVFDDLILGFFIKGVVTKKNNYFLLICTQMKDNSLSVDLAFKILPGLINNINTTEPIVVLQEFVQRFGLTIRIGYQLNKFILRETITIEQEVEADIVEIINPKNHSFLQGIYLKIQQQENKKIINCAVAYCIDTDKYVAWISGKSLLDSETQTEVVVEIGPQLKGHASLRDFLQSSGTISFISNYSEIGGDKTGYLLKIQSDNFRFEIGFNSSHFYFIRNSDLLEYPIEPIFNPNGNIQLFALWDTTNLKLLILDEAYNEVSDPTESSEGLQEIERRTRTLETKPTLPPNSLIHWTRKYNILPETTYKSVNHFNETITSLLLSIEDKIETICIKRGKPHTKTV